MTPTRPPAPDFLRTLGWENDEVDAEMLTQEEVTAARRSASSRRAVAPAPAADSGAGDIDLVEMGGVGLTGGSRGGGMGDGAGAHAYVAGEDQNSVALAAELQLVIAKLAENETRLAENEARLAEKDALVASLSEGLAIEDTEGMNLAVNDSHKMDQEADQTDQHYQQAAAEDAQRQVPAAENRRRVTVVEPLLFGEKLVYHRDGTVEIETADGELIPESDAYD